MMPNANFVQRYLPPLPQGNRSSSSSRSTTNSDFDVGIVDHNQVWNNGVVIIKNSRFGRAFATEWLRVAREQDTRRAEGLPDFPSTVSWSDNAEFIEALFRLAQAPEDYPRQSHGQGWKGNIPTLMRKLTDAEFDGVGDRTISVPSAWAQDKQQDVPIAGIVKLFRPATGFNGIKWTPDQANWGWHKGVAYVPNSTFFLHTKVASELPPLKDMGCPPWLDVDAAPLEEPGLHYFGFSGVGGFSWHQAQRGSR